MMGVYRLAAPAVQDLNDIWDYYNDNAGAEQADSLIANIAERFQLLGDNPSIGVVRPELVPDIRSYATPGTQYLLFYFPRDHGVEIVRVLHGRRDLASILNPLE